VHTSFTEANAALSPDGRWLAYQSNESGRGEVYVRPFPNVDGGACRCPSMAGERRSGRGHRIACFTAPRTEL
jgi:WD40 repeat protein